MRLERHELRFSQRTAYNYGTMGGAGREGGFHFRFAYWLSVEERRLKRRGE